LRTRARRADQNRLADIYGRAAEVFWRKGYHAASLNDLAKAVGLTKPGLYHYIRGKEQILFGIMSHAMNLLQVRVVDVVRSIADPEVRLKATLERHARLIVSEAPAVGVLAEEMAGLSPAHRRRIAQRKRDYLNLIRSTLQELQAAGRLRDVDITTTAFCLSAMIVWLPRWYHPEGRLSPEQVVAEIVKIGAGAVCRPGCAG
jgi:AcrR family transcriptional regulator